MYDASVSPRRLFATRPVLPPELEPAWWAFLDCCDVLEGGRRVLLGVLPVGRVEPAPITVGTTALRQAVPDGTEQALERIDAIAASTDELDDVLDPVRHLMDRLDAFADVEAAFRRRWRCPDSRRRHLDG